MTEGQGASPVPVPVGGGAGAPAAQSPGARAGGRGHGPGAGRPGAAGPEDGDLLGPPTEPYVKVDARRLESALLALRHPIVSVPLALEAPGVAAARAERRKLLSQIDDYLLPRLRQSGAPILVALVGSTGAGKSTLMNSLVGKEVSQTGIRRPTTNSPVLACHPGDAHWFAENVFLPTLPRVRQQGLAMPGRDGLLVLAASEGMPRGVALLDTPDIDSVVQAHRDFAHQFLDASDLWLFMTSARRYADAAVWELLQDARDRAASLAVVLSRVPPSAARQLSAHFDAMLEANDLRDFRRFLIAETLITSAMLPTEIARPVREWLEETAAADDRRVAVLTQTMSGVLDTFRTRAPALAGQVGIQLSVRAELRAAAVSAYQARLAEFGRAAADGALLQGEVLARWQDFAGTGDLMRTLQVRRGRAPAARARKRRLPARAGALRVALRTSLESLVAATADRAAEDAVTAWQQHPAGAALLSELTAAAEAGPSAASDYLALALADLGVATPPAEEDARPPVDAAALARSSPQLAGAARAAVRAWQDRVLQLIQAENIAKRSVSRLISFDHESLALVLMIGVLGAGAAPAASGAGRAAGSAEAGSTTDGSAPADGAGTGPDRLLGSLFGAAQLRDLTAKVRGDLQERVAALFEPEIGRFDSVIDAAGAPEESVAAQLIEASEALEARKVTEPENPAPGRTPPDAAEPAPARPARGHAGPAADPGSVSWGPTGRATFADDLVHRESLNQAGEYGRGGFPGDLAPAPALAPAPVSPSAPGSTGQGAVADAGQPPGRARCTRGRDEPARARAARPGPGQPGRRVRPCERGHRDDDGDPGRYRRPGRDEAGCPGAAGCLGAAGPAWRPRCVRAARRRRPRPRPARRPGRARDAGPARPARAGGRAAGYPAARARGGELSARLSALARLIQIGSRRSGGDGISPQLIDDAGDLLARAGERLRLSSSHTVVALAGGTGSGKSSLFNRIAGADFSTVGVTRPVTRDVHACVWGVSGSGPLLEWLGVPRRYRYARASALDSGEQSMAGLVLLDLPDHDSVMAHATDQVDQLVELADLMIWVLDPQKYADAAVHRRFLVPMAGHAEVLAVVLNQSDVLSPDQLEDCVNDLRRLLDAEELQDAQILVTSARTGAGVSLLLKLLADTVSARRAASARIAADVDAIVGRFEPYGRCDAGAPAAPALAVSADPPAPAGRGSGRSGGKAADAASAARILAASPARLAAAFARAAGVAAIGDALQSARELRAVDYVGWPVTWLVERLVRRDPVRKIRLGKLWAELRGVTAGPSGARQSEIDNALTELADDVGPGLPRPWSSTIRAAIRSRADDIPAALGDRIGAALPAEDDIARWWRAVGVWQGLLLGGSIVGLAWIAAIIVFGVFHAGTVPHLFSSLAVLAVIVLLIAAALVLGWFTASTCLKAVRAAAILEKEQVAEDMQNRMTSVAQELVVAPAQQELAELERFRAELRIAGGQSG